MSIIEYCAFKVQKRGQNLPAPNTNYIQAPTKSQTRTMKSAIDALLLGAILLTVAAPSSANDVQCKNMCKAGGICQRMCRGGQGVWMEGQNGTAYRREMYCSSLCEHPPCGLKCYESEYACLLELKYCVLNTNRL